MADKNELMWSVMHFYTAVIMRIAKDAHFAIRLEGLCGGVFLYRLVKNAIRLLLLLLPNATFVLLGQRESQKML